MRIRIRAFLLALLMIGLIPVSSASAITQANITQQELNQAVAEQQAAIRQKLDQAMLDLCRVQALGMNQIKEFLGQMAEVQIEYIHQWHESAVAYKESQKLEFANYSNLNSIANEKYDIAMTKLYEFKQIQKFMCESDGPKSDFMLIMVKYMDLLMAIFDYLFAVLNLFIGILMAQIQAFVAQMQSEMQANITKIQNDTKFNIPTMGGSQ